MPKLTRPKVSKRQSTHYFVKVGNRWERTLDKSLIATFTDVRDGEKEASVDGVQMKCRPVITYGIIDPVPGGKAKWIAVGPNQFLADKELMKHVGEKED